MKKHVLITILHLLCCHATEKFFINDARFLLKAARSEIFIIETYIEGYESILPILPYVAI